MATSGANCAQNGDFDQSDSGQRLVSMLDEIEKRVESLRTQAIALENEKDDLLQALQTLHTNQELLRVSTGEREEIQLTAERLVCRCLTVQVSVTTPRNDGQEKAWKSVNRYLDNTESSIRQGLTDMKNVVVSMLNACTSDAEEGSKGPIDHKFQAMVLECTAEDQKKIKKKLKNWIEAIELSDRRI